MHLRFGVSLTMFIHIGLALFRSEDKYILIWICNNEACLLSNHDMIWYWKIAKVKNTEIYFEIRELCRNNMFYSNRYDRTLMLPLFELECWMSMISEILQLNGECKLRHFCVNVGAGMKWDFMHTHIQGYGNMTFLLQRKIDKIWI